MSILTASAANASRHSRTRSVRVGLAGGTTLFLIAALTACGEPPPERGETPGAADAELETAAPREDATALAITIDDLPWVGPLPPGWSRTDGTRRILESLRAHAAPATGFVNCGRVPDGAPVLRRWLDAGHALGNHTHRHLDLNHADPSAWATDAEQCDRFLRDLTGEVSLPFRYPYLHRGPTAERYRAGREALNALETTVAPVTINTGDWILDDAYVAAIRASDGALVDAIAHAYVEHVARTAAHYREVAARRVGREIVQIMLLHANALLANELDTVLTRLEQEGFRFVTLETALRDPVYTLNDDYIGPEGLSWLYRIPPATPSAQAWDLEEAARLREVIR